MPSSTGHMNSGDILLSDLVNMINEFYAVLYIPKRVTEEEIYFLAKSKDEHGLMMLNTYNHYGNLTSVLSPNLVKAIASDQINPLKSALRHLTR